MMEEGQNDYPLAKAVQEWGGYPHCVKIGRIPELNLKNL